MSIKISLFGAAGRMGQTLAGLIVNAEDLQLTGALEHVKSQSLGQEVIQGSDVLITSDYAEALNDSNVVIDFALGQGLESRIKACREAGVAYLIGTTGLSKDEQKLVMNAGDDIATLWASNMSLGGNIVFAMAAQVASSLGLDTAKDFSINITETHHIHKQDAPSGTALSIGQAVHDSVGDIEIEYDSYREGEVIGDHTITFESEDEVIEITHHAKDRRLFAKGALHLARKLARKEKGHYLVRDII